MEDVSNVHTVTEQSTSAVPSTSTGRQSNGFSTVPSRLAGQPNGFSAVASTSAGKPNEFSAVPSRLAGQTNELSAVPSTSAGQPNGFSAVPSISTGRQWNISAIYSLNRILKARVKKIRRTGFDYSRICVDYIRAYRDLKR